jgi:hypothetical protein
MRAEWQPACRRDEKLLRSGYRSIDGRGKMPMKRRTLLSGAAAACRHAARATARAEEGDDPLVVPLRRS